MSSSKSRKLIVDDDDNDEEVVDLVGSDEEEEIREVKPKVKTASPAKKKAKIDTLLEGLSDVSDMDEDEPKKKKKPAANKSKSKQRKDESDFSDTDDDEEDKPKKKKSVTKTRKGTTIEFEGDTKLPKTKKEVAAAKKAAQAGEGFPISSGDASNPIRIVPEDDPIATKYNKMTLALLKDWLRANEMLLSGKKEELVARCIDGEVNGRIPRCARCKMGKVSFHPEKGVFSCGGYFDDDAKMMIRCSFQEPSVDRLPWVDPETAAAAKAAGDTEGGDSAATSATAGSDQVTDDFVQSVASLPPRDAADKLAGFLKGTLKLAVPDDEKKVRLTIGPILMSNRTESGSFDIRKVVSILMNTYPAASASGGTSAGGAAKPSGGGGVSKVEANEPIAALMEQLAQYEKKKGGENVQFKIAALKKAAIAIRGLGYEITDGLAMGKPGKSKVEGIGKGTAKTIQEFLDSGKTTSPYLESLKKEVGE